MSSDSESNQDALYTSPRDLKKLRACYRCHLIKTEKQFNDEGCDNCPFFKANRYLAYDYTSGNFEGLISVIDTYKSWISRYLNLSKFVPGCYALKIRSEMPERLETLISEMNIPSARNPE